MRCWCAADPMRIRGRCCAYTPAHVQARCVAGGILLQCGRSIRGLNMGIRTPHCYRSLSSAVDINMCVIFVPKGERSRCRLSAQAALPSLLDKHRLHPSLQNKVWASWSLEQAHDMRDKQGKDVCTFLTRVFWSLVFCFSRWPFFWTCHPVLSF